MQTANLPAIIQADTTAAIHDLTGGGPRPVSPVVAETVCARLAHLAYRAGRHDAVRELKTVSDVAGELEITVARVRVLAVSRGVGWQVGRGTWVFRPEDVDAMRVRKAGRPTGGSTNG